MANQLTAGIRKVLAEQGLQFEGSDDDLTLAIGQLNRPEIFQRFPELKVEYDEIREANSPGVIGSVVNTAKSAFDRSVQAKNVISGIDQTDASDIADREMRIQGRASSVPWEDWGRAEGMEAVKVFLRDPIEITSHIVAAGLAGSTPALAGGLAGGAAGSALGPVGGTIGAAVGTGAGSLAVEYGGKYLDTLREAGADLTNPDSILRVVNDPEVRSRAAEMGLRRGLPVAIFDAASAGLAGKFLKGVRTASAVQNIRRGAGEALIQGGLGGAGEVAGAVSAGEEIRPGAVFEEVIGELGPGAVEVGGAALRRRMITGEVPTQAPNIAPIAPNTTAPTANSAPISTPLVTESLPSPARRVATMTDDQKVARLAELMALPAPAPVEVQEMEILRAILPAAAPVVQPAVQPAEIAPNVLQSAVQPDAPIAPPAALPESQIDFSPPAPVGVLPGAPAVMAEPAVVSPAPVPTPAPFPALAPAAVTDVTPNAVAGAAPVMDLLAATAPAPAVPMAPTPETRVTPELTDVPPVAPSLTLEQRLTEELKPGRVESFAFGRVNESSQMTSDVRDVPEFDSLTPEMAAKFTVPGTMDASGNRSLTRVAVVLEAPDGRFVKAGLLPRQEMASAGSGGTRAAGPAVQSMAVVRLADGVTQKLIKEGGNKPALLADVIAAGYKVRAFLDFDAAPGRIFQRFATRAAYDASYGATGKTVGSAAAKTIPTRSANEGVARRNAVQAQQRIQGQIDALGTELSGADPARAAEINEEIQQLYADLSRVQEPRLSTEPMGIGEPSLPAQADRANQFAIVAARLRQAGARVDIFARSFLQAQLEGEYRKRLDSLVARYENATEETQQEGLQELIEQTQARIATLERVRGVSYGPNHIALGLDDIQSANLADLVTLLHEAGHAMLQGDPQMETRVLRAVTESMAALRKENAERDASTGSEARTEDPEELLVQTMAQRLAEDGIPDSPSLARALFQWVKDLYFRLAMAVQEAFGRQPSPELALGWFENQLRRLTGGDFDYRFANIFSRFAPETAGSQLTRQTPTGGTPGGIPDYYDPLSNSVRQPQVRPDDASSVDWNLRFSTEAEPNAGEELDIPFREANARIMAAGINEVSELAEAAYTAAVQTREGLTFDQWWADVGSGETPAARLAEIARQVPGAEAARIGGERMTDAMNGLARVQAKALLYSLQNRTQQRLARSQEMGTKAERDLVSEAKLVNKVEGDLRNAEMHEATFRDQLKDQIRQMSQGIRRGLDTASRAGELAQAVRDAEGLAENDPLPAEYQTLFKRVLADEVPLFDYVDAIAKLDLPLTDLTANEFYSAIEANAASNDVLARLMEPRNRPLLVALRVLTRKNAEQVDMLQLRRTDAAKYLAIHGDLKAIREASEAQLKEISKTIRADRKATTFADRLKRSYVEKRARLRRFQRTIQEADTSRELITALRDRLVEKVDEMETNGMPAPSEWRPNDGATYLAMYQDEAGTWRSRERPLRFSREGPPVNAEQLQNDLAANWAYLNANKERAGAKTYELVRRQTQELQAIDVQRKYPEVTRALFERWLLPSSDLILSGGGAGAARAAAMLKKFQFITFSNYESTLFQPSQEWANRLRDITKTSGLKDQQAFLDLIYDPILYYVQTEPGREEGPALREAVRGARRRLTAEPGENFDEQLKDFLRRTKAISESFVKIAQENGVFIADKRLDGELRNAVARGWLTVMRRMNSSTVSTILREMDGAGWKLEFKDAEGKTAPDSFERGVAAGKRVVKATTFDALMPDASNPEQAQAATAVLENPQAFAQAIGGFFTPGIIQRWLIPFVNKPGEPLFVDANGNRIDQLDVQQAWADAGGNVAAWIDALGQRTGLRLPEDGATEGPLSPEAQWRVSMLRQIDDLYQMESRIAADSNQVRNLFDSSGRPAQLLMDARENDLLPPEHVQHMGFDPISSRNLLATLAFHAAFGRNGVDMEKALAEVKGDLLAKKAAFEQLRGSTLSAKKDSARALGYEYGSLKNAAKVYGQVMEGEDTLRAAFGFGNQAGVLGDVRTGLQLLQFVAQQTTNNPKTGLLNLLQATQRPIARRTLDPVAIRDTARAGGEIVKLFFGELLESFGLHILRASKHAKEVGAVQGKGIGDLSWTETMGIAAAKRGEEQPTAIKVLRTLSGLQRKGARIGFGESREFPRMANVPFLSNTMQGIGLAAAISNGTAEATSLESLVKAAMDYFVAHPEDAADPTFRLTAKDLRAQSAAWFNSPGSFDYFRRSMVDYGIGNLEDVARGAIERGTQGEPILTREQVLKAAMMSNNELDLQGSINTNPGTWASNPILKFATPLLGFPIRQMNQIHQAFRGADGRRDLRSAMKALGILAVWAMPVGLAFTFLTDEYDDKFLKKKTNLGSIDSDNSAKQNALSVLQRLSRAGNIYGLGMDFVSTSLAGLDPTTGQRPFSLDTRILAFSQLRTMADAISAWINSDFATTFVGFERPLIQAMGGGGALHAVDIFNAALGFDNQEARLTHRTNVQQWLRAAGREAGLEIRRGGGGSVNITPVGTWVREMSLAAMANDRLAFLENYRRAIDAAREAGEKDPDAKVLESWRSRNPLSVFATKPTQLELQRTLSAMSDTGREAVTTSLRLFDQFTRLIEPSDVERYQKQQLANMRRSVTPQSYESLRRSMANQSLSVR